MKAIPFLLMATALQAAEPRFQFRSFIQDDGTLMNVKLDTTTGQTWRLDRALTNRRDTTLAGKATERKLAEAAHTKIDSLEGYTLSEILAVINALNKQVMGKNSVPLVFRAPAANQNENANNNTHQLVPPARQFGEPPVGINPNTGLPFPQPGQFPGRNPLPGVGLPGVGNGGGLPGATGGRFNVDPVTGLPLGPGLPPAQAFVSRHQRARIDADLVRIRNWDGVFQNISSLDLITEVLNALDAPVRCVIDENIVYLLPESAMLTTRDGKTNKPKFEDRWVEIKTAKEK